jgi:choline dehydrogenase-like flavoprotein
VEFTTDPTLRALVDRIIPADDGPSGWQAGVGDFLQSMLTGDLRERAADVETGLRLLDAEARARHGGTAFASLSETDQDAVITDLLSGRARGEWDGVAPDACLTLMVSLTAQGFYGDPDNGGNRNGVTWDLVGYRYLPEGASWPEVRLPATPTVAWDGVAEHYDAVVVGSGAGGGVAACVLSEAGMRVLLVERGRWLDTGDLRPDHLRSQRLQLGYATIADPPAPMSPRVFSTAHGDVTVWPTDPRWHNNAMTVGGGTRVYGAQAWRFSPEDFRMATTYGVPEGSSLADWPISYEDLEEDYDRAEWELGVSGDTAGQPDGVVRRRGYPMPPLPENGCAAPLRTGAHALGLPTGAVPLLVNSRPYNGRGACIQCGACVGFGCPGEFKTDTRNTVIPRAVATGRCDVLPSVEAERVTTGPDGRVTGVALVAERDGRVVRRQVTADTVVLSAGAIETARLLLNSHTEQEPDGLGNATGWVGRNLQGHVYAGAMAVFDQQVQDGRGPGPSIATHAFRHHNDGLVGGAMIANDFVPLPLAVWTFGSMAGALPTWGLESKQAMRHVYPRMALVMGPVQEIPDPAARVTVDPDVRDRFGVPVARISGGIHPETRRTAEFIAERAAEWARASGAVSAPAQVLAPHEGPSGGQHQAGTCRMGTDPATSVTDPWGRVWGHDNLVLADGSVHVTNGGVNPVLTILALAYRVSRRIAEEYRARVGQQASGPATPSSTRAGAR